MEYFPANQNKKKLILPLENLNFKLKITINKKYKHITH